MSSKTPKKTEPKPAAQPKPAKIQPMKKPDQGFSELIDFDRAYNLYLIAFMLRMSGAVPDCTGGSVNNAARALGVMHANILNRMSDEKFNSKNRQMAMQVAFSLQTNGSANNLIYPMPINPFAIQLARLLGMSDFEVHRWQRRGRR